jgi:hypothetical protein
MNCKDESSADAGDGPATRGHILHIKNAREKFRQGVDVVIGVGVVVGCLMTMMMKPPAIASTKMTKNTIVKMRLTLSRTFLLLKNGTRLYLLAAAGLPHSRSRL